jgi:hypothetical protein
MGTHTRGTTTRVSPGRRHSATLPPPTAMINAELEHDRSHSLNDRRGGQPGLRAALAAKDWIRSESAVVGQVLTSSNGGSPVSGTLVRPE